MSSPTAAAPRRQHVDGGAAGNPRRRHRSPAATSPAKASGFPRLGGASPARGSQYSMSREVADRRRQASRQELGALDDLDRVLVDLGGESASRSFERPAVAGPARDRAPPAGAGSSIVFFPVFAGVGRKVVGEESAVGVAHTPRRRARGEVRAWCGSRWSGVAGPCWEWPGVRPPGRGEGFADRAGRAAPSGTPPPARGRGADGRCRRPRSQVEVHPARRAPRRPPRERLLGAADQLDHPLVRLSRAVSPKKMPWLSSTMPTVRFPASAEESARRTGPGGCRKSRA